MEHCHGGLEDAFHLEIGWFVGSSRSSSRVYPQCISFGLGYTPAMSAWQVPVTKWRKGRWCLGGVGMAKFDQPNWYVNFQRMDYTGEIQVPHMRNTPNVVWRWYLIPWISTTYQECFSILWYTNWCDILFHAGCSFLGQATTKCQWPPFKSLIVFVPCYPPQY